MQKGRYLVVRNSQIIGTFDRLRDAQKYAKMQKSKEILFILKCNTVPTE